MRLSDSQMETFDRMGYLIVENVFSEADLRPVIAEIGDAVGRKARELVASGELSQPYDELPFESRLAAITAETDQVYWSIASGRLAGPGIFSLLTHPGLLDLVETLVGPEIVASSAYRLRPKVPGFAHGVVPWHQDSGYFEPFCDRSLIVTVWIPLVDATPERGCLQVIPNTHRGQVYRHVRDGKYLLIPDDDLPEGRAVTVPVPKGGFLLLGNRTPHRSTDNVTDVIRWSMDLRYQSAHLPTNSVLPDDAPIREPRDDEPVACYPPEADFLVRSRERPDAVVRDPARFAEIRTRHVSAPVTRRWQ